MTVPMTMDAVVRTHRSTRPDTTAVVDPRDRATYRELDERSAELAARFVAAGVTKGSRVGLLMPNGVQWVTVAVALTRVGAVLVPLSTLLTGPELAAQLRGAAVRLLITVDEFRGRRRSTRP